MNRSVLLHKVCATIFCFGWITSTNAALLTDFNTVDDATLTLSIEDTLILGVNQQWGTVRIVVNENDVTFSSGDAIDIWVYEDDAVSDDLLWQTNFTITAGELAGGIVDRIFPLVFTPAPDDGDNAEIYAEGLVTKDDCGVFCSNDNPITSPISVALVEAVPIPATVWLFGSGLLGLVGIARRKKSA